MNVPDLGFEVLLQPALFVAAFVWGLVALIKGITTENDEILGSDGPIPITRRHWFGGIKPALIRWTVGGLIAMAVVIVPLGHRAVVWTAWEEGPSATERARGVSLIVPLLQQAHIVNVRTQRFSTVNEEGAANSFVQNKELLQYNLRCTVTWHVEPTLADELISGVGPDYIANLISQNLYDACREGIGDFTAVQLASKIELAQAKIERIITPELEPHGLVVEGVQLEDVVPPEEFLAAVKSEEVSDRNADEAENRVREARAKADQQRATAAGQADAMLAVAEAEQARLRMLGMTPSEYIWFTRDNLVLPQVMAGADTEFILPVPDTEATPAPTTTTSTTTTTPEGN